MMLILIFSDCFTAAEAYKCRNQSMFYYKQDCVDVAAYCRLSKLSAFNLTHCVDPKNSSNRMLAETSRKLISASEDYFKLVSEGKIFNIALIIYIIKNKLGSDARLNRLVAPLKR
jgi:hypothetical protein